MALVYNKGYVRSIRGELEDLGTGFDFESVRNVILDLGYLKNKGIYEEFFDIYKNWEDPISVLTSAYNRLPSTSSLLQRAMSNNLTPEKSNIFSGSVDYFSLHQFYQFLEKVYSMNLGRQLQEEDVKAIFSSNILEKIILGLENFDRVNSTNNFDDSFFHDIKEVKWTDKHTERFFDKLHDLLISKSFNEIGSIEITFKRELKRIAKFLAVCSTVNKNKTYITTIDVINAYKTIFKIIKTDISPMVNKKEYKGFLICSKCNGYYSLEDDEIPDDFTHCRCGGTITYVPSLEKAAYYGKTFKIRTINKKLIAGTLTSLAVAIILINL
ncbi:MAG: hypothetical protein ABFC34_17815 [Methanobacterium sp.]